jgi:hypothetical protein
MLHNNKFLRLWGGIFYKNSSKFSIFSFICSFELKFYLQLMVSKGVYRKRADGTYFKRKATDMYEAPFGCDLQFTGGDSVKMSMINVFKERYSENNGAVLYDEYESKVLDGNYPYRYFPMPSDSAKVLRKIDLGTYEITYTNAYGKTNLLKIHVYQEIRQNHALGGAGLHRVAQDWEKAPATDPKTIFQGAAAPFVLEDPDNSKDIKGWVRIDDEY